MVADEGVDAPILALNSRGVGVRREGTHVAVTAQAGEPWDEFVAFCVAEGFAGIECLSGIPGSVGATPIQNVGAYGQDVSETILSVDTYDRSTLSRHKLDNRACGFAYRQSVFKQDISRRYVVLAVTFLLTPGGMPRLRYPQLQTALGQQSAPTLEQTRQAVLRLRRTKGMIHDANDANSRSCGSFFTNPIVSVEEAARVSKSAGTDVPQWTVPDGSAKLSAAWLIERTGFSRGTRRGTVGLSEHHSLAIVNLGEARAAEVVALGREVQAAVHERFGVRLMPEPNFWGFSGLQHGLPSLVATGC